MIDVRHVELAVPRLDSLLQEEPLFAGRDSCSGCSKDTCRRRLAKGAKPRLVCSVPGSWLERAPGSNQGHLEETRRALPVCKLDRNRC